MSQLTRTQERRARRKASGCRNRPRWRGGWWEKVTGFPGGLPEDWEAAARDHLPVGATLVDVIPGSTHTGLPCLTILFIEDEGRKWPTTNVVELRP